MLRYITSILFGAAVGVIFRFVFMQFLVANTHYFLDPVVSVFWEHVFHRHPGRSALQCEDDCKRKLYNLPS